MKQILIDYDEYLELEKKSTVLEKLKKYISINTITDSQLNIIRPNVEWTLNLNKVLTLIKENKIDVIVKGW